ncbi:MAG: hypothetical protein AB1742_03390, partial [bacterium]
TAGVTYKTGDGRKVFSRSGFEVMRVFRGERGRVGGVDLRFEFGFPSGGTKRKVEGTYRLYLFDGMPYVFMKGWVRFPETTRRDVCRDVASRTGSKFDSRWLEVLPAQIAPGIRSPKGGFLKVWKHNFHNAVNCYELNFGAIDPRNRNADSFNNHVTDGWVAVSNGEKGLLLAHDQVWNTSFAMCPMRLRESGGIQRVYMNPFGTYHGKQFSHLPDGSGAARELTTAVAQQLKSSAPSYNGETVFFHVMLAPYIGGAPPPKLQVDADAFSHPPGVFEVSDGGLTLLTEGFMDDEMEEVVEEYGLADALGWGYADFLEHCNSLPPEADRRRKLPAVPSRLLGRLFVEALRAKWGL